MCAYATATSRRLGCRTFTVDRSPKGNLEAAAQGPTGISLAGWAIDNDGSAPVNVHVYVDGAWAAAFTAAGNRPDIATAFPGQGPNHGFTGTVATPAAAGNHSVCAYAINASGTPGGNPLLGCRTVTVTHTPTGNLENATQGPNGISLAGWAIDPDTSTSVGVHVYVDGAWAAAFTAAGNRPDIATAFPGQGPNHGFTGTVATPAAAGNHSVCAYAINAPGTPGGNPLLGCRTVTVTHTPVGNLESLVTGGGTVTAKGWALDRDTADPIAVHVYVDGGWAGSGTAAATRTDVGAAYPGYGNQHGYSVAVAVTPGSHTVCAYAINAPGTPGGNPLLGCLRS